ncbi:hypothetical protein Taro_017172 [Colocasia esculenta]|uniref:Protein FAR1-RELATED SEQUENCE n=1 Tax=Colocasia esculenta TaxID=4460 RepID=A0A843UYL6_COLES|nr:hypothetical protein [Colocasia esculenta]
MESKGETSSCHGEQRKGSCDGEQRKENCDGEQRKSMHVFHVEEDASGNVQLECENDVVKTPTKEKEKIPEAELIAEPCDRMEFECIDDVRKFYNNYVKKEGFGIASLDSKFVNGMPTSQRSINHFFDDFVTTKTTLFEFISKYAVAIERRFDTENQADVKSWEIEAYLKTISPYEKQVAGIYTRAIFQKFQQELVEVAACHLIKVDLQGNTLVVTIRSYERVNMKGILKQFVKEYDVVYRKEEQEDPSPV